MDRRLAVIVGERTGVALDIVPRIDEAAYGVAFDTVKALIADGDTYQVNLTFKAGFRLAGDPVAFGVDQLRYYLLREVTFGQDGSYSAEAIVAKVNADLANSFGNLAQRTL